MACLYDIKMKCPKCGGKELLADAHVTQVWKLVDGCYEETIEDWTQTIRWPDEDDLWTCMKCRYDAPGKEFIEKEPGDPYL